MLCVHRQSAEFVPSVTTFFLFKGQRSIFCLFCPHEHLFLFVEFSRWLPRSLLLPGNSSLQLSGLLLLLFFHKTCLTLKMVRPSRWQRPLRSSFALTPAAAMTQCSRSPAPACGKKNDRRNGNARSKSCPSGSDYFSFQNPGNGICKFHNFYGNKAHKCIFTHFPLLLFGKLKRR